MQQKETNIIGFFIRLNIKNGDIKIINKKSGLPNNVIYGVLEDQNGFLWLSTYKGLCQYNKTTAANKILEFTAAASEVPLKS